MPRRAGLTLGQIPHCTELNVSQMHEDCLGVMRGFGIDCYIIIDIHIIHQSDHENLPNARHWKFAMFVKK